MILSLNGIALCKMPCNEKQFLVQRDRIATPFSSHIPSFAPSFKNRVTSPSFVEQESDRKAGSASQKQTREHASPTKGPEDAVIHVKSPPLLFFLNSHFTMSVVAEMDHIHHCRKSCTEKESHLGEEGRLRNEAVWVQSKYPVPTTS